MMEICRSSVRSLSALASALAAYGWIWAWSKVLSVALKFNRLAFSCNIIETAFRDQGSICSIGLFVFTDNSTSCEDT